MTVPDGPEPIAAAWRRVDVPDGLGYGCISGTATGFRLEATEVVHDDEAAYTVSFTVDTDTAWQTTAVCATANSPTGRSTLALLRSHDGRWNHSGQELAELAGCIDADIAATPLTNTLTINRLGLAVGESAALRVVWVDVPSMEVTLSRQRYERLAPRGGYERYVYSDDVYGPYVLTADHNGMVADYEGLARRVWYSEAEYS